MRPIIVPLMLVTSLFLAGCAADARIVVAPLQFNESSQFKECAPPPKPPNGSYTQKDVAKYIAKLKSAHGDCKSTLAALNRAIENYNSTLRNKKPTA